MVEAGVPDGPLLAAKQRAQKGRPREPLSRPSCQGVSPRPEPARAGSDTILYNEGQPNSFTVVPKVSRRLRRSPS